MDEILLLSDFISTSSTQKTCFPYHEFEQKIIRLKEFKKYSGWCGTNRLYISLILSQKKEDDYGIVGTFLIDTRKQNMLYHLMFRIFEKLT